MKLLLNWEWLEKNEGCGTSEYLENYKKVLTLNLKKNMELKIKIGYAEILELIRQLPANQIAQLKRDLSNNFVASKKKEEATPLKELLLKGPVMSDEEYEKYQTFREHFYSWRTL